MKPKTQPEIKIEKGFPMPKLRSRWFDLLSRMKVGDSFFAPDRKSNHITNVVAIPSRKLKIKLTMRQMDGGVRVWRIK